MKFQDIAVGEIFSYADDERTYLKVPHKEGYTPSYDLNSSLFGGVLLSEFARNPYNPIVYEFGFDSEAVMLFSI